MIGRRFSVEEERRGEETSLSDDVAEMHKVMCESDQTSSCEKVSIQVRITRTVRTIVPSVKVMSVDVRQKRRELMSRRVKCTARRRAERQGTTLKGHTGGLQEYVNKKSATEIGDEAVTQKKKNKESSEFPKQDTEGSEIQKIGRS